MEHYAEKRENWPGIDWGLDIKIYKNLQAYFQITFLRTNNEQWTNGNQIAKCLYLSSFHPGKQPSDCL